MLLKLKVSLWIRRISIWN